MQFAVSKPAKKEESILTTDKWTQAIDRVTAAFEAEFGRLSPEQLNRHPEAGRWSISQHLAHLIKVNESYYPVLAALHEGSYKVPWVGKIGFLVRYFGQLILRSVQPGAPRKLKTFPIWEPGPANGGTDILDRFRRHQAGLKRHINDAEDLLDRGVVISSPANANIVYKLETAFDILVAHEERHLQQARDTLKLIG